MEFLNLANQFALNGKVISTKEFGSGHINTTFKVTTDTGKEYVLQKINKYVFRDPVRLMSNATAVTGFIREKAADPRMALHFIPTHAGHYCYCDDQDEFWRMYDFVDGFCLDAPESDEDFYQSALAFGRFQDLLSDFPADTLFETIQEFHNTIDRYRLLKQSVQADPCGRVAGVHGELQYLFDLEQQVCRLQQMRQEGRLPLRVTHNDTKLNNVLLDKESRKSLCVLDLDTVMPGLSAYDFGDAIRSGAATAAEDERDYMKMEMDLHLFEVFAKGFLEAAPSLTEEEVKMLPLGALTMTVEVAVRFLKDYLDGDLYFKTAYPEHNLIRSRTQIKLAADMLKKWDDMNRIVAEVAARR